MVTLSSRLRGMQTLLALLATALACVLARPPAVTNVPPAMPPEPQRQRAPIPPPREFLTEYIIPRFLLPNYLGYDDTLRIPQPQHNNLLDQEINMINQMNLREIEPIPYEVEYPRWTARDSPISHMRHVLDSITADAHMYPNQKSDNPMPSALRVVGDEMTKKDVYDEDINKDADNQTANQGSELIEIKNNFALTPLESGYYESEDTKNAATPKQEEQTYNSFEAMINQRKTRQNPNLSKQKTLISEHLDKLRTGFTQEDPEGTAKPYHIHVLETPTEDPAESIYGVVLLAAVGTVLTVAVLVFAFGWFTLMKKAKAAADVDYPAYGVTGPNMDTSGDRKLAQSAHMYHYQHQKQQIIAMERNGMDRNGSVSDPESEDENEEGDYTVYECPGFATTGNMEVKNPLFKEEATPATPGKCDVAKSQPKE